MIDPQTQAELRAKFNPDGSYLRTYQLSLKEMLIDFDKICQEHGVRYWLSSGTLLGAVRHGGFIPWDDDIDVDMTRNDFNKLIKSFKESGKYILQTYRNDPYYYWPFAKLRLKDSEIKEGNNNDIHYKYRGNFIDIFLIEYRYDYIATILSYPSKCLYKLSKIKKLNIAQKILFFSIKHLSIISSQIIRTITSKMSGKSYGHSYGSFFCKANRDEKEIFPLSNISFEGYLFPAPSNPDAYLTRIFGNYMIIPNNKPTHIINE